MENKCFGKPYGGPGAALSTGPALLGSRQVAGGWLITLGLEWVIPRVLLTLVPMST